MYEYWVEPILIKSLKDGIDTKCSSYLKTTHKADEIVTGELF